MLIVSFTRVYLGALLLLALAFCFILLRWSLTKRTCSISRKRFFPILKWNKIFCCYICTLSAKSFTRYFPFRYMRYRISTKTVLSVLRTVIFSNGFDHLILVTVFISEQKTKHKTKLTWAALFPIFLGFPNSQFSILGPILNKLFPSLLIVLDTSLVINQANTIEFWL